MNPQLLTPPKLYLDVESCETIYDRFKHLVNFNEPLPLFKDRYPNRLESITNSISQEVFGEKCYPTILDAAAGYLYKICCAGHPFANGNKRLGILFTHVFLLLHDLDFNISREAMYGLVEEIATLTEKGALGSDIQEVCKKVIIHYVINVK